MAAGESLTFPSEAPADCDEKTVTMIGRGIAFSNDWCMDDTYSFLVHGPLDGDAEKDMFEAGVKAREQSKGMKPWNPNDPTNW